jgi:hypothetical protein
MLDGPIEAPRAEDGGGFERVERAVRGGGEHCDGLPGSGQRGVVAFNPASSPRSPWRRSAGIVPGSERIAISPRGGMRRGSSGRMVTLAEARPPRLSAMVWLNWSSPLKPFVGV